MCVCRVADGIACRRFFWYSYKVKLRLRSQQSSSFISLFVRCFDHDMLRGFSFEVEVPPV